MTRAIATRQQTFDFGPHFVASATGLRVTGKPTFDRWQECGGRLRQIEGAVQWWIGDWLNYGAATYGDKYKEAVEGAEFEYSTIAKYAYVAQNIQFVRRRKNLSFSVHLEVASLPTAREQDRWLAKAEVGDGTPDDPKPWSVGRLRRELRTAKLLTRQPTALDSQFDIFAADPPWSYSNSGFDQSAAAQYPTMATETIAALPLMDPTFPKHADDSVLFLWATSPLLPDALIVMAAWGWSYKASMVWAKDAAPGIGWWVKTRHELLLIGERGTLPPAVMPDSVVAASAGRHSEKPGLFYDIIQEMYPQFSKVELFARTARPGWEAWGNQAPVHAVV